MGVFGTQLVCTMIMCTVLSKVIPHWSPAQWLLCNTGLSYYLHPTDDQLREKKKSSSNRNNSRSSENAENGTFTVLPKNIDVNLQKTKISSLDVFQLRFYSDYQWLLDFSVCSIIVYIATEIHIYFNPGRDEVNLSMVWCLLLLIFVLKVLFSITLVYFKSGAGDGEKALVVLALFCYLLLAMMVLIVSEMKLELGLDEAYAAFNASATQFMKNQEITSVGVISKMAFKGCAAVACAVLGACLAFPGLRLGKMHWDAVRLQCTRRWLQLLLHCAFLAPAFVSLLWVRPLARHYLVIITWPGYTKPLLSAEAFSTVRVVCVLVTCALRLLVLPVYLQAYLDMARAKLEEQRTHAGKTTNKNIQRQVASVFYYLCVVALQYLLPLLLSLVLALMLKTLGGLHWRGLSDLRGFVAAECVVDDITPQASQPHTATAAISRLAASTEATAAITTGVEQLRKLLVPEMWLGLLGFSLWWSVTCWFISGLFGLLYQRFFTAG